MAADYMKERYRDRFGIDIVVPDAPAQETVDRIIFDELVQRVISADSKGFYLRTIDDLRLAGAEAIILGCTEIFLLVCQKDRPDLPMFNTTTLHVEQAVRIALE